MPSSFCQPLISNWHMIDWIVCFSIFMLYVAWKRGLPRKLARFVLFRPVKKHSFNLLCVLDLFFQNSGSKLCLRFFWIFFFICCCTLSWQLYCVLLHRVVCINCSVLRCFVLRSFFDILIFASCFLSAVKNKIAHCRAYMGLTVTDEGAKGVVAVATCCKISQAWRTAVSCRPSPLLLLWRTNPCTIIHSLNGFV